MGLAVQIITLIIAVVGCVLGSIAYYRSRAKLIVRHLFNRSIMSSTPHVRYFFSFFNASTLPDAVWDFRVTFQGEEVGFSLVMTDHPNREHGRGASSVHNINVPARSVVVCEASLPVVTEKGKGGFAETTFTCRHGGKGGGKKRLNLLATISSW